MEVAAEAIDLRGQRARLGERGEGFASGDDGREGGDGPRRRVGTLDSGKARLERFAAQPREKSAEAIHPARLAEAQGQLVEGGDLDFGDSVEREERASEQSEGGISMGAHRNELQHEVDRGDVGLGREGKAVLELVGDSGFGEDFFREIQIGQRPGDDDSDAVKGGKPPVVRKHFQEPGDVGESFLAVAGDECELTLTAGREKPRRGVEPVLCHHYREAPREGIGELARGARNGEEELGQRRCVRKEIEVGDAERLGAENEDPLEREVFGCEREPRRRCVEKIELSERGAIRLDRGSQESGLGGELHRSLVVGRLQLFESPREEESAPPALERRPGEDLVVEIQDPSGEPSSKAERWNHALLLNPGEGALEERFSQERVDEPEFPRRALGKEPEEGRGSRHRG